MSGLRATDRDAIRLLKGAAAAIYLVDAERRLVFVNDSCARWLRMAPEQLVGRVCRYQSGADEPLQAAADALCPPPEALRGQKARATVARSIESSDVEHRWAEFIPLGSDDEANFAILAIIDLASRPNPAADGALDESRELHDAVRTLRQQMAERHRVNRLVGRSSASRRIRAQVELAASGRGTVLIVGPLGCGAQDIARTIHYARGSNAGAFTPISCSALPVELLLSTFRALVERSGHEPELTASVQLADVDALPAEGQLQLRRMLEEIPSNLRVMSTSEEDLAALAERGEFPHDLAMLLGTLVIEAPPLAKRREDIPLLAQLFLEETNTGSKQLRGFTSEALDRLAAYDWPGDVDELAGVVREACAAAEGVDVAAADLPKRLEMTADAKRSVRKQPEPIHLEKFLAQIESEVIGRALRQTKGNKSRAARLLGLTRPRLYRRMVQLGMVQGNASDGEGSDDGTCGE